MIDASTPARDVLALVGEAIYGKSWRNPLGKALGVHERTMRAWASGKESIAARHPLFGDLVLLCKIAKQDHLAGEVAQWRHAPLP